MSAGLCLCGLLCCASFVVGDAVVLFACGRFGACWFLDWWLLLDWYLLAGLGFWWVCQVRGG